MLRSFLLAGYSEEIFWSLTLRKYILYMEVAAEKNKRETDNMITAAWLAENFSRQKKLEKLEVYLTPNKVNKNFNLSDEQKNKLLAARLRGFSSRLSIEKGHET